MPRWGSCPLPSPNSLWCSESSAQGAHQGLTASGPTAGSPQALTFPVHTPGNSHLSPKQVGHTAATRKAIWLKHQNMPVALPVVLLALYYLYHLKNHAKYYRYLNRERFKILTIWREAYTKIRKPFKERAGSQSTHPTTVHLTPSPNMTVCFWIRVLYMPQGLWGSPQCSSGGWRGRLCRWLHFGLFNVWELF